MHNASLQTSFAHTQAAPDFALSCSSLDTAPSQPITHNMHTTFAVEHRVSLLDGALAQHHHSHVTCTPVCSRYQHHILLSLA